jgi:pimeloyl-ACP methyl ester carboxylesterase
MRTNGGGVGERGRPNARPMALVLSVSLLAVTCTGNPAPPAYETQLLDAPCPPEVSQVILTEHTCSYLVVPEDRSDPDAATVQVFVVRVMPLSGNAPPDPLVLLGEDLGVTLGYELIAPTVARVNRELIVVEPRGSARSRPSLTCPEVADAEWDLLSITMSDPAWNETFLSAAGECYDRLVGEGIDPSAYNLEEMAADVEDLRRAMGIEEWNLMTISQASRIALEVMDRYPDHVRSAILDSPEFPGDAGFGRADDATREAVAVMARYCEADPACAASFPDVADALDEAASRLEERPIRVQITLPDARPADAVIDGGSLVRFIRWQMARSRAVLAVADIPALIYDALQRRFGPTFQLESTDATCIGYNQPCFASQWTHGLVFSELCHDELPFAHPAAAGPGFHEAFGDHPFVDLCRVWSVPPGDPPRVTGSKIPTLVLVGQMDPDISQPVLEKAMAGLGRGFLVTFDGLGSNVLRGECGREIQKAWIEDPLQPPDTNCRQSLSPPPFIAPIGHGGLGKIPPIPEGTYRVEITTADGVGAGLGEAAASWAGVLRLTLDQGRFRLHYRTDSPRQDEVGVYRGAGHEVTFVVDEPFVFAGLSWTVRWRARNRGIVLAGTDMRSREDALFFRDPGYLAVVGMWMESHPWRLVDRSS